MAAVLKVFAAVFVVAALSGGEVSAQTHHVVGEDDGSNIAAWLSGRVFRVGDKIWFNHLGAEESIVELKGLEDLLSCNLTNPIKMYTDKGTHVALEKEGSRFLTSGNPDSCKNGLKLPVNVEPNPWWATPPEEPFPAWGTPPPPAPPVDPFPAFWSPPPPPPSSPPPPHPPSTAAGLDKVSFVLFAGLLLCHMGF